MSDDAQIVETIARAMWRVRYEKDGRPFYDWDDARSGDAGDEARREGFRRTARAALIALRPEIRRVLDEQFEPAVATYLDSDPYPDPANIREIADRLLVRRESEEASQ